MPTLVLLVDPDEFIVDGFSRSLERHGFEVIAASNERECLRQLCEFAPSVVVLEPGAHDSWGRKMLTTRDSARVPFVVVSRFSPDSAVRTEDTAWLIKPVSLEALVAAVRRAAELRA
jgi:DNA-binding NtrC family response regulator